MMNNKTSALLNNNFLNFVPLICSLMVILIHTYNAGETSFSAILIGFVSHGICTAAVPTFFFMSGYLFFRNADTIDDVFNKQIKRIKSVLLPFVCWSLFYYIFYAVGTRIAPEFFHITVDVSLLGLLKGVILYQYSFPLWYMFQLCIFVLLTPAIFYLIKNKVVSLIVFLSMALVSMFGTGCVGISVGGLERVLFHFNFFSYYFAGCLISHYSKVMNKIKNFADRVPVSVSAIAFALFGFMESLLMDEIIPSFNPRCIVPFVFISFFILMMKICNTSKKFPKSPISTMIIYGVHSFCISVVGFVIGDIGMPTILYYVISFILVAIMSYAIGFIMKLIKPIYFMFSGNR